MTFDLRLPAIEPSNPAGYLAALGLLRLATGLPELHVVGLSWTGAQADQSAVLHTAEQTTVEELARLLAERHSDGWLPNCGKDIRKLTPDAWHNLGEPAWIGRPDLVDKNGELEPTAWRMFIVKERVGWLDAVRGSSQLMHDPQKWLDALVGPWPQTDGISPLGFDPSAYQVGATQASDASAVGILGTAGAIWLAVNALPLFPTLPAFGPEPLTAGLADGAFTYPTWSYPLPLTTIAPLCRVPWANADLSHLRPYGIRTIWRSPLRLTATGRRQLSMASPI